MRINLSMIDGEQKSYVPLTSLRMLLLAMQSGPIRIFPQTFSSNDLKNMSPQNNSLDKTDSSYRDINYKTHYSIHDLPWVSSLDQHKFTPQKKLSVMRREDLSWNASSPDCGCPVDG